MPVVVVLSVRCRRRPHWRLLLWLQRRWWLPRLLLLLLRWLLLRWLLLRRWPLLQRRLLVVMVGRLRLRLRLWLRLRLLWVLRALRV